MFEAAIDFQRDQGQVSAWLAVTEKPQLCKGLVEGVLIGEKHSREKWGEAQAADQLR